MLRYLLDTTVAVRLLREHRVLTDRFRTVDIATVAISVVTRAEVVYGAHLSREREANLLAANELLSRFETLPLEPVIDTFARQKARLRRTGQLIEDFDLLIGSTALVYKLTLVTNNTRHFRRLEGLSLEDWSV